MKYYELDKEEERVLADYENGDFRSVAKVETKKRELKQAAGFTYNKTHNINIRLSMRDLQRLKTRAMREGIPYQTLVSSILHRSTE